MGKEQFLTVSEVTRHIKRMFDDDYILQDVWIRGELSNFKRHSRGHMYFTIKDEQARMQAVMFAGNNRFLKFQPEDGMKVLVRGEVTVYEPYGQYQFYAREMQPDGIGSLYLAYEELKSRLEKEGLFLAERKKNLPKYPKRIGIITSPTGAAVRDIITTIRRRYPVASITLLPVLVQGDGAAPSIAKAIRRANEANLVEVLIVGRGGGSIEELWAFNEEEVARAIYQSTLPIISAVGHETDFTIADFVADVRAATPTAAAEIAVPELTELTDKVKGLEKRLVRLLNERLLTERERLKRLDKSYAFRYPGQLIKQKEQDLDKAIERLEKAIERVIAGQRLQLSQLTKDLHRNHPNRIIEQQKVKLQQLQGALVDIIEKDVKEKGYAFGKLLTKLELLSPLKMMDRGYNLTYNEGNKLIKSVNDVKAGERLAIRVKDGIINSIVEKKKKQEFNKGE